MKKAIIFLLVLVTVFCFGCKSKKTLQNVSKSELYQKDSVNTTKVIDNNKAISDLITLYNNHQFATGKPECDSVTQVAITNLLRLMNSQKESGDNSYKLYYDEVSKQLKLLVNVAATKNERTESARFFTIKRNTLTIRQVPVKTPLPKWQLYLFIIGCASITAHIFQLKSFIQNKIKN